MYRIFIDGNLYSTTSAIPKTIPGIKLTRLDVATEDQLAKHSITVEVFTPPSPPEPTQQQIMEQLKSDCADGLQNMLDEKAREFGFKSIHTAISWGADRPHGAELKAWGKTCWEMAEAIQTEVLAGERTMPESVESFLSEMPAYVEI